LPRAEITGVHHHKGSGFLAFPELGAIQWRSCSGEDIRKGCRRMDVVEIHSGMKIEQGDLLKLFQEWGEGR
jgi:hypothetical protein